MNPQRCDFLRLASVRNCGYIEAIGIGNLVVHAILLHWIRDMSLLHRWHPMHLCTSSIVDRCPCMGDSANDHTNLASAPAKAFGETLKKKKRAA